MAVLDRGVTLTLQAQTTYTTNLGAGFRFTVTASNPLNMPAELFLYTVTPNNYTLGTMVGIFIAVANQEQLVSVPVGAPNPDDPNQYFRLATLDLVFATEDLANQTWSAIQQDISNLITALKASDVLSAGMTVRIGDTT